MISNYLLGQKISSIRLSKGLSQEEFATLIGDHTNNSTITKGTVNNWEHGRNKPNKARLLAIANIGNMTVDELINDEYGWNLWEEATGYNKSKISDEIDRLTKASHITDEDDIQAKIEKAVHSLDNNGSSDLEAILDIDSELLTLSGQIDSHYEDPSKTTKGIHHLINDSDKTNLYTDMNQEIYSKMKEIIFKSRQDIRQLINEYNLTSNNNE